MTDDDEHGRRAPVAPGQLAGPGTERVDVEPVLDDEQALGVPQQARRLVADRRGEPDRPGSCRRLDPDLRPASLVRVRPASAP